jgi:hypothetical protein
MDHAFINDRRRRRRRRRRLLLLTMMIRIALVEEIGARMLLLLRLLQLI